MTRENVDPAQASLPGRRRLGGRQARKALRSAAPSADRQAVWRGPTGGHYRPLSDSEQGSVHRTVLNVLDNIGMAEVPDALRDQALAQGCHQNEHGRLCFPAAFVEDMIAGAGRHFPLYGQDPAHDIELKGKSVYFGTGGAAVRTLDVHSGRYRPSTLRDVYDFARVADAMDNISWFTRCVVATDVTDNFGLDINTAYAIAAGTSKPIGTSFVFGEHVAPVVGMFDMMLGGEGKFAERPFCKAHISPVVSPLRYGADAFDVALAAIDVGMPINAIIAAQAGATAPAPPGSMLVQTVAETLAGLIMVNLFAPGYPVIFSNWPFVSDLRTGAFSGSGGEISVLNAAAAQMAHFYDLPAGVSASMADSKVPDAQAGYEKGISTLAAGLSGANLVYESAGMFASLLGASFEGMVIDDEMLSNVLRAVRGIEINDEALDISVIRDVVLGPGHFLGHDQTIAAMERDYYYPKLGDRTTPDDWEEQGSVDIRERGRVKAQQLLTEHFPKHLGAQVDQAIRDRFEIALPTECMRPS